MLVCIKCYVYILLYVVAVAQQSLLLVFTSFIKCFVLCQIEEGSQDALEEMFKVFDQDKDGVLNVQEMRVC